MNIEEKNKQIVKTIVTWAVVFIAYAYLCYRLYTMDWSSLGSLLSERRGWIGLALIVALMPLNLWLEAGKWRCLLRDIYPMSYREAQRQVYYGFIGAFATPYRAGDYPSRVLLMEDKSHWGKAIAMGVYGSVVLTAVIVLAGLIPFWAYVMGTEARAWMVLPVLLPLCIPRVRPIAAWSIARYAVYSLQMYLMLCVTGVEMTAAEAVTRLAYYYLLVTITPNIPISDPAIKGSWAVIAFGEAGAIAALGLWVVNTVLPLLIGGIEMIKREKK